MFHHSTGVIEHCELCRFDGSAYTNDDVAGTLRNLGDWFTHSVQGIDAEVLNRRPEPTVWSPAEYLRHCKRMLWSMAGLMELMLIDDRPAVQGRPPADALASDEPVEIDVLRELTRIDEEASRMVRLWAKVSASDRARVAILNGAEADLAGVVRHAIHDATHHLSDIGRTVAALGAGTPDHTGRISRINASAGGVPKPEIARAVVGYRGIEGDRQNTRKHHGRVWQAMCLWSTEVIERLAAEGHPVGPGDAGENIDLVGIDWSAIRPGARMELGGDDGVLLELSGWTEPCSNLKPFFIERNFRRIDVDRHPGDSRIYAKVIRDGVIRSGDSARVY